MTKDTARRGRCACGLKLTYHFASDNSFMSCPQAQAAHPRAKVAKRSLRVLLCNAGALMQKPPTIVTGLTGVVAGAILPAGAL